MELRNLRAVLREKNLSLDELSHMTGIQKSILELIMLGAHVPSGYYRLLIAAAIDEPLDNTLFESGLPDHLAPIR